MGNGSKILFLVRQDSPCVWIEVDAQGYVIDRKVLHSLEDIPVLKRKPKIIALLPGRKIFCQKITLPKTSKKNKIKALRYILEDKLITPVTDLHIYTFRYKKQDFVAAVDKKLWNSVMQVLSDMPYPVKYLIPEYWALPYNKNDESDWTIQIEQNDAHVRTGRITGFSISLEHLPFAIKTQMKPGGCCRIMTSTPVDLTTLSQVLLDHGVVMQPSGLRYVFHKPDINFLLLNKKINYSFIILWGLVIGCGTLMSVLIYRAPMATVLAPADRFIYALDRMSHILSESEHVALTALEYRDNKVNLWVHAVDAISFKNFQQRIGQMSLPSISHTKSLDSIAAQDIEQSLDKARLWRYVEKMDKSTYPSIVFSDVPFDRWMVWLADFWAHHRDCHFALQVKKSPTTPGAVMARLDYSGQNYFLVL